MPSGVYPERCSPDSLQVKMMILTQVQPLLSRQYVSIKLQAEYNLYSASGDLCVLGSMQFVPVGIGGGFIVEGEPLPQKLGGGSAVG